MVQKFELQEQQCNGNILVFVPIGYIEAVAGKRFKERVEKHLQEGVLDFVIDFSKTELISSPGVAALLDLASRIVDDFNGHLATFGLDKHHSAVLEMAGFFFLAVQAKDLPEAISVLKE